MAKEITLFKPSTAKAPKIPLYNDSVQAGFPSPATDYQARSLDLNQLCIKNPVATYFVRVSGDSMIEGGIFPDDVLVVDRSLEPRNNDIVIAEIDGELMVKKLELSPTTRRLVAMNKDYPPVEILEDSDLVIFGVVTSSIHMFRKL